VAALSLAPWTEWLKAKAAQGGPRQTKAAQGAKLSTAFAMTLHNADMTLESQNYIIKNSTIFLNF
jgi:hypothetical protein